VIESLRIEALAIVESAELEFAPGLNALTGETGAGKSIVLGALSLLAGGRAAARSVRDGADEAVVEALFRTEALSDLERELEERGLAGDAHELIVRRAIAAGGRSRAWLSGRLIPIASLAELFAGRIEISSQHDSQALLRSEHQGELLDRWAGLAPLRGEVAAGVSRLRAIAAEREQLRAATREREQRRDFLVFQVEEIDEAKLDAGEMETLRALRSRLAHVDRIGREVGATLARLVGDPGEPDAAGAADQLADASRALGSLVDLDPELAPFAERLEGALAEVRELATDLERRLDGLEADPERLAQAEERLHRIEGLQRKYGADVLAVLSHRDTAAAELEALEGADAREAELDTAWRAEHAKLCERAAELTRGRTRAAEALARAVEPVLRELAMPEARFGVELVPATAPPGLPCGAGGAETAAFLLSANRGEKLRPLRQVASGGELSRAFLALKQALRGGEAGMVLVFDEVDAGVGGEAADRVGRRLAELAERHQVLCITHLPQIAAYASRHFRVRKQSGKRRTGVSIETVEGVARIEELARMAGGDRAGDAARDYARELLSTRSGTLPRD
jgi:DNA repair protein RecN (Recombination protein N)